MEKLTCKSCGSELSLKYGAKTVICELCGMEQTVPVINDPKKLELLITANGHRRACRFDIAKKLYESIITQYPDENEAYWGKILCEFGIEYVEDFATARKIPTCHRTVRESIFNNTDYRLIMNRASAEEKVIYETEAKEIDRLQKEIKEKANKEQPYDIFICFKDSDENGRRTTDSQYANKIYTHFTRLGYKVFFSPVTLKSRAGEEYEPIIYSALYTAKVMLFVCANKEYVSAPWVRNEWSRYLEFMREDYTKVLLPCLKDVYPYDLPEELSKIQVMDITDIDFYESLTRQIDSKFGRVNTVTSTRIEQNVTQSIDIDKQIQSFLERIEIFLEDKDWKKADEYAERILDVNPKCAKAYLYKAFCEYKVTKVEELAKKQGFTQNPNFKKSIRFGDPQLSASLSSLKEPITTQTTSAPTPAPAAQKLTVALKVGDICKFGKYYQSNDATKEDIEWQVLAREGNKALIISKYALDCKPYNSKYEDTTWEICSLRKWLNSDFLYNTFRDAEKAIISTVWVSADKNPSYSINPGNSTLDKIFLLSISEANKYFSSDTARECKPTAYAKKNGAFVNKYDGNSMWWLRFPGFNQKYAAYVYPDGDVNDFGDDVDRCIYAVRPVLWVNLES